MSTQINLTYFGATGTGPTVKEAKQDAGRKLENVMNESAAPILIGSLSRPYSAILFFEPQFGWSYKTLTPDTQEGRLYGGTGRTGSFKEAEQMAKRHLADLLQDVSLIDINDTDGIFDWERKEHFRQAYADARTRGYSDVEAHSMAATA